MTKFNSWYSDDVISSKSALFIFPSIQRMFFENRGDNKSYTQLGLLNVVMKGGSNV